MNARAALRLERLGFQPVYRYAPGKADWLAAGLPTEGANATRLRAGRVARRNVATCQPDETVAEAARRTAQLGDASCLVVDPDGVVLGRLRGRALDERSDTRVDTVMEEGPTTVRADEDLASLAQRMHGRGVATIIVTDPDGRLIGVLHRDDADRELTRS